MNESHSISNEIPTDCSWLFDGMAAVRSVTPKKTYKEFIECLFRYIKPDDKANPKMVGIMNDNYVEKSVKESIRRDRFVR